MRRAFLRARWERVAMVTYAVEPAILQPHLPPGCELDLRDGRAFVSLVAFEFLGTRVKGIAWPGHRDFSEINLRFYVRNQGVRGVCFLREYVPRRVVAWAAKWIYNEPYRAAKMRCEVRREGQRICVEHGLCVGGVWHRVKVTAKGPVERPGEGSMEHFLKEHEWGFGPSRSGKLVRYRVEHPVWDVWPVESHELDWDWTAVYGERWGFLGDRKVLSVMLAVGSEVGVWPAD